MIHIVYLILKVDMKGSGVESAIQPTPVSNIDTNNNNYYYCLSIVKKQALSKPPSLSNACNYF